MVFTDSYYNQDPSQASKVYLPTPANKKECPCDTCPMTDRCTDNAVDCKAFRIWSTKGDYNLTDINRLIRSV